MIGPFTHERAETLTHALRAVAGNAVPYAGGTELLAAMKLGLISPDRLVDIKRVADLRGVSVHARSVRIGATTPHAAVAADPTVRDRLPMLADVTHKIANPRVRWQGTVGGNLCFAEPRSDLVPALIALQARLLLRTSGGERTTALDEFVSGPFTVDRQPDELLVHVEVPTDDLVFQHFERVQLLERPTANAVLVGRTSGWRLCVGAAGYLPTWRDVASPGELDVGEVAAAVEPIEDTAGSADYKRHLVMVLVARALSAAHEVQV